MSESACYPYMVYRSYDVAASYEMASTPVLDGTLSVSVNVQVYFTFE